MVNEVFRKVAHFISQITGNAWTFTMAILLVIFWFFTGPIFNFSETWQLFINTLTTIVTFLMVFLIQNTQNRDTKAIHLKLDELIRSHRGARASIIDVESLPDQDLELFHQEFKILRDKYEIEITKRHKKRPKNSSVSK